MWLELTSRGLLGLVLVLKDRARSYVLHICPTRVFFVLALKDLIWKKLFWSCRKVLISGDELGFLLLLGWTVRHVVAECLCNLEENVRLDTTIQLYKLKLGHN